jgi:hypothetical protein
MSRLVESSNECSTAARVPLLGLHAEAMMALDLLALCELPQCVGLLETQLVVSDRWKERGWAPPV